MARPSDEQIQALVAFSEWIAARTSQLLPDLGCGEVRSNMYAMGLLNPITGMPCDWLLEAAGQHTLTEDASNG